MNGGFGLDHVCYPTYLPRLIATILFPPLGVFLRQHNKGAYEPTEIITSFILTALFYFPGLIHALYGLDCASHSRGIDKASNKVENKMEEVGSNIKTSVAGDVEETNSNLEN